MYQFYVYKYTSKVLEEYVCLEKGLDVGKVINRDTVLYFI